MPPDWTAAYVGIPYLAGGRDRAGLDCWGLVALVWRERFGLDLPNYDGPLWQPGASARGIAQAAERFTERFSTSTLASASPGDGLLWRVAGRPLHVGLWVSPGWMLHAEQASMSCLERVPSIYWPSSRLDGVYRPKELAHV